MTENDSNPETDDDEIEPNYAQHPERARKLATLQQRIESVEQRADQADALAKTALDLVNEKDDEIEALRQENEELRAEIEDLRESQSLLQHVNSTSDLSVDERALALLQTLYRDASSGQSDTAHMTVREAWTELRREIPRSRVYDAVERAETLVDDADLCRYKKEPRGHQPPSRLILDLSDGDLPTEINGHPIKRGGRR